MRFVLVLALAIAAVPTVQAQPISAYYGLALGSFDYYEDDGSGGAFIADKADSYRLMVGYQFTDHLTAEGGWGRTDDIVKAGDIDFGLPFGVLPVQIKYEFEILTVRLLGVLPFDNGITLLGGLGYADIKWGATVNIEGFGEDSVDLDEGDITYYAGVQYDWERVAVRIAYEKYDVSADGVDIDEASLAFFYKL